MVPAAFARQQSPLAIFFLQRLKLAACAILSTVIAEVDDGNRFVVIEAYG